MSIKLKPFEVPENDPFKYDALNRKESIEILTQFIGKIEENFVLTINSPWGSGKTVFIRLWNQFLTNKDYKTIYYNAWKNDFIDDPMLAILSEFTFSIQNFIKVDKKIKSKLKKFVKDSTPVLKGLSNIFIKISTSGKLSLEDFANLKGELKVNKFTKLKKDIEKFKKSLSDLKEVLSPQKPLIVFVDEIDRCCPNYAIDLLEKIKHFFNVPGIIFILAIDKIQLMQMIETLYGQNMHIDGYLKRFIDLEYTLPETSEPDLSNFVNSTYDKMDIHNEISMVDFRAKNELELDIKHIFTFLANAFDCSLRDIEKSFIQLVVVLRSKTFEKLDIFVIVFFIFLKIKDSILYNRIIKKRITIKELADYIRKLRGGEEFLNSEEGTTMEAYLARHLTKKSKGTSARDSYQHILDNEKSSEIQKERAKKVLESISGTSDNYVRIMISQISKVIDIGSRFD